MSPSCPLYCSCISLASPLDFPFIFLSFLPVFPMHYPFVSSYFPPTSSFVCFCSFPLHFHFPSFPFISCSSPLFPLHFPLLPVPRMSSHSPALHHHFPSFMSPLSSLHFPCIPLHVPFISVISPSPSFSAPPRCSAVPHMSPVMTLHFRFMSLHFAASFPVVFQPEANTTAKHGSFQLFGQKGGRKTRRFSLFSGRRPELVESRQGDSSLQPVFLDTGSRKTLVERHPLAARYVGGKGAGGD